MRRRVPMGAAVLMTLVLTTGCNKPEAVSVFCASSSVMLLEAAPIFKDIGGSCLRQVNLRKEVGSFEAVPSDPSCEEVSKQAAGAVAVATVLAHYFDALNALASVNTVKLGSDNGLVVAQAAGALQARPVAQAALGSIGFFLTTAATQGYQQKSLVRDLSKVNGNVAAVTDALAAIVRENYLHQELDQESNDLQTHYKEFAQQHPDANVVLHLDERWQADHTRLEERRRSAEALVSSLGTIKTGVADLAKNAHTLKSRQLAALLQPYTAQLQLAIPKIQEAF